MWTNDLYIYIFPDGFAELNEQDLFFSGAVRHIFASTFELRVHRGSAGCLLFLWNAD